MRTLSRGAIRPGRAWTLLLMGPILLAFPAARAAGAEPEGDRFFREKIRPVLEASCFGCHSATATKVKGGLLLDSREALLRGGDTGPAVVPGKGGESLLIQAIRHEDGLEMPPEEAEARRPGDRRLRALGGHGRPVPGLGRRAGPRLDDARRHWAFQPVTKAEPPDGPRRGLGPDPGRRLRPGEARSDAAGRPPRRPSRRELDPPGHVRPDRPAADARGGRGLRRRPVARRLRAGGRPAARQPALRRAVGAALARRGPVRGDRGVRVRPAHPRRLAVPRLRDRLPEPRQAVRPLPDRADRRRRDRAGRPGVPGRLDLPPARPGPPERREPRDRPEPQRGPDRADRHPRHRVPRPDRRLRPLPQPQARADLAEGLLPPPGVPGGDRGARHRPRLARRAGRVGGDDRQAQGRAEAPPEAGQAGDRRRRRRG